MGKIQKDINKIQVSQSAKPLNSGVKKRSKHLDLKFIFLIFLPAATLFPSSVLIIFVCMLPTISIVLRDEKRYPFKWVAMGGMNLAGALIPLTNLWFSSNNMEMALYLLNPAQNIGTYIGSYLGAFLGLAVYNLSPIVCDFIIRVVIQKRIIELKILEKDLKEEWIREDEAKNILNS